MKKTPKRVYLIINAHGDPMCNYYPASGLFEVRGYRSKQQALNAMEGWAFPASYRIAAYEVVT